MKRVKLVVAYDGTNYRGWQVQNNGETIESMLNRAISSLTGEEIHVMGSSRTDSGVHAMGNVAVFDTEARMAADKFSYALNQRLPEDIRIQNSCEVPLDSEQGVPASCLSIECTFYVSAAGYCTDAGGGALSGRRA